MILSEQTWRHSIGLKNCKEIWARKGSRRPRRRRTSNFKVCCSLFHQWCVIRNLFSWYQLEWRTANVDMIWYVKFKANNEQRWIHVCCEAAKYQTNAINQIPLLPQLISIYFTVAKLSKYINLVSVQYYNTINHLFTYSNVIEIAEHFIWLLPSQRSGQGSGSFGMMQGLELHSNKPVNYTTVKYRQLDLNGLFPPRDW